MNGDDAFTGIEIANKVALVTSANRGIGKAIVEAFIREGAAKVFVGVRSEDKAAALVAAHGDKIVPIAIDYSDPASIAAAPASASDVEIVVSNAGILKQAGVLDDTAIDTFEEELQVNVYSLLRVAKAFAPVLKANGGGAFVQLNSIASLASFPAFATDMGVEAGMEDMGYPVEMVSEGIVASLKAGDFHLFPDTMAKSFEKAYHSFAEGVIEAEPVE